jgi:predicted GIY-YIG superfamily endonuclease
LEEANRKLEKEKICKALKICKYPKWALEEGQIKNKPRPQQNNTTANNPNSKKQISEKLARVYRKHGITLCSKPGFTLRQALVAPKDPIKMMDKCGTVYRVNCAECEGVYIGETGRTLQIRMGEHEKSVSEGNQKSALSQHNIRSGHRIDFDSVKIIQQAQIKKNRKVAEAIQIRVNKPDLNRDQGQELSRVYDQILKGGQTGSTTALRVT